MIRLLICLFLLITFSASAQNTIGLPEVINYTKQEYKGGLQNWGFAQDGSGMIYIANNEGVISFDGNNFKLYPLPNKTIARSIYIFKDKIYVGGQGEIGYFEPNAQGVLTYHSLLDLIPARNRGFGDVWDIVHLNNEVFFRSTKYIFQLSSNKCHVFETSNEWVFMEVCRDKLYIQENSRGLLLLNSGKIEPILVDGKLSFIGNTITAILPLDTHSILITTLKDGLYKLKEDKIVRFGSAHSQEFINNRIYNAIAIDNTSFVLASSQNGVFIINDKGYVIQSFSKNEGLQTKNVLSIFKDAQSNLWLGLDNGVDLVCYNSSIKKLIPQQQDGSGYAALIHHHILYAGTSEGLFYVPLDSSADYSLTYGKFTRVPRADGQIWRLDKVFEQVLVGAHEGAFTIDGKTIVQISNDNGFWNFYPYQAYHNEKMVIAGGYDGVRVFSYTNGRFVQRDDLQGFNESSRFLAQEKNNTIWISHPYNGVFKVSTDHRGKHISKLYDHTKGLPSKLNNHVYSIKGEMLVATDKGIYHYNSKSDRFEPSSYYFKIFGAQSIRYLKEDQDGNIWFVHHKSLGIVDFSYSTPKIIYFPELTGKLLSGFEFVYPIDRQNILVGAERGYFNINYAKYKSNISSLSTHIRNVIITQQSDSLIFGGYFENINGDQKQNRIEQIKTGWKRVYFQFSSALFGYKDNIQYSYRLKGFDDVWSQYSENTAKEYTNLSPGTYTFEVKAKNNTEVESDIAAYAFVILPPWYLTIGVKIVYLLLFIIGNYMFFIVLIKKFKNQRQKFEAEQKKLQYIHELEKSKAQSEIVLLRNAKLESEIQHKNTELAGNAMHLVQKAQLITKIKSDITQVIKESESAQINQSLKRMIRNLSEDDRIDDEWKSFTMHFDKVHNDFFKSLKEKHPTVTNSEIKLSAYLRMNLSTKEIAQLLNISVRGVEIGRYRLRKKLQLPTEANLYDYLIKIGN